MERLSSLTVLQILERVCGSRPAVGSSSRSSFGLWTRALAMSALRLWPPDSFPYMRSANSVASAVARASSTAPSRSSSGIPYIEPRMRMFSLTVSLPSIMGSWNTTPMSDLIAGSETSCPNTDASPESAFRSEHMMDIVVDFPAPLGPRNAKNVPSGTENEIPFTASRSPKLLRRSFTAIASIVHYTIQTI